MKRIYNFNQFINEGYLDKIESTVTGWIKSMKDAIKSGLVKLIPSGPKAGKPIATAFDPNNGSIEAQLLDFFKGTPYAKMSEATNEARVPLTYPKSEDVLDVKEPDLKRMIKTRLKSVLKAGEEADNAKDESGRKMAMQGVLDVKPIFIFGAPGIGKTQIVAQVCDELGKELYGKPLNLAFVDGEFAEPVDFAGVPSVVDVETPSDENPYGKGITRSNVAVNLLPNDNGTDNMGGILFIDELNRMPQEVVKVFMKLAQSRRLGQTYNIPNKWYIVAAGNRAEDDPREVKQMGTALRDRFSVVNFLPTVAGLRKYIEGGRLKDIVIPELLDFLEFQEEYFHNLDPSKQMIKYPTPRAWTDAAIGLKRIMDELSSEGVTELSDKEIISAFQVEVGYEAAASFLDFYKIAKEIPVKDLMLPFTNPDKAPLPDAKKDPKSGRPRADYAHALLSAIIRKSKDTTLTDKEVCNFVTYLQRASSPEWGNAAISNLVKEHTYLRTDAKSLQCLKPLADKWGAELGF
jgi:hypothetical protein